MSTRVVERVDDWDQESFSGGYRALQGRADASFSGVFRASGAELYMTRGTVVGVRRGTIEDFEGASGTVFEAPTEALPLLAVMQDRSDEVRAKYYSEDTSIRDVDGTLEDGGFTGYVELSENVLSGDYYLVYHRGNSMSVGFVGNASRLITGDEAFETTDDEVGIYEVRPVDIDPIQIPEPVEPEPEESAAAGAADAGAHATGATPPEADESADGDDAGAAGSMATAEESPADPTDVSAGTVDSQSSDSVDTSPEPSETEDDAPDALTPEHSATGSASTDHPAAPAGDAEDAEGDSSDAGGSAGTAAGAGVGTASTPDDRSVTEDPDESAGGVGTESANESGASAEQSHSEPASEASSAERTRTSESLTEPPGSETDPGRSDPSGSASASTTQDQTHEPETEETGVASSAGPATDDATTRSSSTGGRSGRPSESSQAQSTESGSDPQPVEGTEERSVTPDGPAQLETRAIPSLDPELTMSPNQSAEQSRRDTPGRAESTSAGQASSSAGAASSQQRQSGGQRTTAETNQSAGRDTEPASPGHQAEVDQTETEETTTEPADSEQTGSEVAGRIEELQELLEERETELKSLESDLHAAESERDSLRRELEQVRSEREELESEKERLESELHRLEEELGAATNAQQRITPQEALSGTDLFVRYDSKGDATLAKARDSGLRQQDVAGNLQLEKHTQFEADVAAVGGREYDEFLEDTVAYEFAHWVVYDLLFEIQSTGHTDSLSDLYQALPKINRIELNGAVNATYVEDGEQVQSTESFDVVFRERMGGPLLVANINESRQGATEGMMEQLITAAERVGQTSDQFAAAFLVTESFFEPEALETVEQSTRGGILSRDKRKSYVNLSRKNGYHLCLVEARNQNFHLEVPEL